eukprot:COSAG01_NODE_143_length_24153_cov_54.226116_3_plen_95_part_00
MWVCARYEWSVVGVVARCELGGWAQQRRVSRKQAAEPDGVRRGVVVVYYSCRVLFSLYGVFFGHSMEGGASLAPDTLIVGRVAMAFLYLRYVSH